MNLVILKGRLGKDPETSYTQSGKQVCRLSLATSKRYTDAATGQKTEKTEWHRVTLWDKTADIAARYLAKGAEVLISGEIHYRQYTDKEGGQRTATEIVGRELELIGGRPAAAGQAPAPTVGGYAPGAAGQPGPAGQGYAPGAAGQPGPATPGYGQPAAGQGYAYPPAGAPAYDEDIPF